jgi:hypothetical protein
VFSPQDSLAVIPSFHPDSAANTAVQDTASNTETSTADTSIAIEVTPDSAAPTATVTSTPGKIADSPAQPPIPEQPLPHVAPIQDSLSSPAHLVEEQVEESTPSYYDGVSQLRTTNATKWEITSLFLGILIVAVVRAFHKRKLEALLKAFTNSRVVPLQLREEHVLSHRAVLLLSLLYVVVIALFAYQIAIEWGLLAPANGFSFFMQTMLFIVLVYVVKFAIFELLAEVLELQHPIREYLYTVVIVNVFVALLILPIVAANALSLHFSRPLLILGMLLVSAAYLYRNWRALKISFTYHLPVYYIFLYLCTLEILPTLVLVKLLQAQLH